jgi:hypothetical protein
MTLWLGLLLAAQTRLVVTSGVNGDIARPACAVNGLAATPFGSEVAPAVQQATREGAIAVDTGGLLSLSGVARFAAQTAPKELAALPARLGYRALFLGVADLAAPRGPALALWRELRQQGVPVLATNLRCKPEAADTCTALGTDQPVYIRTASETIAFIAVLPLNALSRVAPEEAKGLSLEDPAAAIARATKVARAAGATWVVASIDEAPAATAAGKALELAQKLPADGRPDLLLGARAGAQLLFARPPAVKPALASAPAGEAIDIRIREAGSDADIFVRPLATAKVMSDAVSNFTAAIGPAYCAAWGKSLAGGHLSRAMDGDGLLELAAKAVRAVAHAEVAIVNRAVVDSGFHPALAGELSASDVYAALPYDEPIDYAEVSGEWLTARAKSAKETGLAILGVPADGSLVNGRPIESSATYRVATLRFLAEGGDGALPRGPRWSPVPRATLRSSLLELLEQQSTKDPRDALPDPARAVEWTLRPDFNARFSSSSISNPGLYTAAPLQRSNVLTAGLETNARLTADSPDWLWENAGLWRYTSTHTAVPESVTHDDLESLRSTLTERTLFGPMAKVTPEPYVEAYGETESAATDGVGSRRWLGRGSLGLRLSPHPKLSLKVAAALERQTGDGAPRTLLGVNAQLAMTPWELFRAGSRRVQADSLVDAFIGGETSQTTVRAHAGLTLDLIGPLSLVLAADLYAERDGSGPFGVALDTSAGLRLHAVERDSSF